MDRYQRIEKPRTDNPIGETEVRVTAQGLVRNYINYALSLLQERQVNEIVLTAMGQAINKAVVVTEIIKKRIPRLHQDVKISSVSFTDIWEPIEEGLIPLETTRQVSMISITLSYKELDRKSPGYQPPAQSKPAKQQYYNRQPRVAQGQYNAVNEVDSYGQGRGRGGGRGRGRGQGWGRGGYGTYEDYDGGYSYQGRGGGYPNQGRNGGYSNNGRGGGYSNQGRGGYSNQVRNGGYSNQDRNGGYSNQDRNGGYSNQGRDGGYSNQGRDGGYMNHARNGGYSRDGGYSNQGRGGQGRGWGNQGNGYGGGRGSGRGYGMTGRGNGRGYGMTGGRYRGGGGGGGRRQWSDEVMD